MYKRQVLYGAEVWNAKEEEGGNPMTRKEILAAAEKCVCGDREEEWRFVPGFNEHYMVSNFGRVKSLKRTITVSYTHLDVYKRQEYTFLGRVLRGQNSLFSMCMKN